MTDHRDTLVIGAGHNGLVCAATLAAAGQRVLVLEAAAQPGGAARTREFAPGFAVSAAAHLLHWMPRALIEEMKLARHGLRFAASGLGTVMLDSTGGSLRFDGTQVAGEGLSNADIAAYAEFRKETLSYARILARAFQRRAPRLVDSGWHDRLTLLRLGLDLRLLSRERMRELLRIGLMNIYDLANERFTDPRLRAAVALDAVLGTAMGPRSPNTVMSYLYRRTGEVFGHVGAALPIGGMGALAAALAAEARARGVEIRTGARVAGIDTAEGRVSGVRLQNGECISAARVISNADPRTTMKTLVGYRQLDAGFVRRIEGIRMRGTAAKLHLALDALPLFPGLDTAALGQRLLLGGDMDAIELAFNPCKYRESSLAPMIEFCIPTLHDPSLAPEGKHVLSAIVQYVAPDPVSGWNADNRAELSARVMAQLERVAPGIGARVLASELLTPADLAAEFGMCGGHWHHGEISVDQLLMLRPVPLAAQYAMPLEGLWLCGAGTHPGGGIMGLAGRNCAQEILRRRSRQ